MKRLLAVLALAAACSASALPAIADPAADALKAKLTSAMQGVKSFRVSVEPTAGGEAETRIGRGSVTTTVVLPDKMETAVDMSGMSVKIHTATGTVLFSDFNNPANVIDVPK